MADYIFKNIQEHSNDLAILLSQVGYTKSSDWLFMASGIVNINFEWNRFDKTGSNQWCRPAWEYDVAKSEVLNSYIETLTIFNYVWGAFENLIEEHISKSQIKKYGKVNCVTKIIKEKKVIPIYKYSLIKTEFSQLVTKLELEPIEITNFTDINGIDLQLIYKIRNEFAHGEMHFPEAEGYSFKSPNNLINIISISSRIVLCSMQALLIYLSKNDNIHFYSDAYFKNVDFEELSEDLPFHYLLSRIQMEDIPELDKFDTLFNQKYYDLKL